MTVGESTQDESDLINWYVYLYENMNKEKPKINKRKPALWALTELFSFSLSSPAEANLPTGKKQSLSVQTIECSRLWYISSLYFGETHMGQQVALFPRTVQEHR